MAKTTVELKAKKREEKKKKVKALRLAGSIPAVIYGRKFESTPIVVDNKEFRKKVLASEAGHNLIFNVKIASGETVPVITQNIQRDPLTGNILHLDFMNILIDEKIKAKVPVEFTGGVPVGVKDDGGVLIHGLREIEIKCLPMEIPDRFKVDVSKMAINDSIHISDLEIGSNIEVLEDMSAMIAAVTAATKEEEPTAIPIPDGALPEGVAAAGAEGAVAAPADGAAKPEAGAKVDAAKPAPDKAAKSKDKKE
ncbi:MAG: 50S ribosomal protein L25 [bacterium]